MRRSAWIALAALGAGALGASCIEAGYPLAASGQVDLRADVAGALFAADVLDPSGRPVPPRQSPWQTGVTLFLSESNEPAWGAYVEVRVDPSEALALHPEGDGTCDFDEGAFRCQASEEGYARFVVASEGDWSGEARIVVSWADRTEELDVEVLPAGLPEDATGFDMVIGGLDDESRVLATYLALACTIGPVPEDLGSKWRPGEIRAREARVRASPPPNAPGVVEHAPVLVESLHAETELALAPDCADRTTRLRVLLDATGESERFYVCFSDLGGDAEISVRSGQKVIEPDVAITVEPEPRLLRIRTLQSTVEAGTTPDLFEISAFNADRVRIAVPVDLRIGDDQVIALEQASVTLQGEAGDATVLAGVAVAPGTTELRVTPRLLSTPECLSEPVTVIEPAPDPP